MLPWLLLGSVLVLFVAAHFYLHTPPKCLWGWLLSFYYRTVKLIGLRPSESDMATIVIANHPNAFIDPFALEVALGRPLLRTVRADWTQHWLVKWFTLLVGAVPLAQFNKVNQSQNRQSFDKLFTALKNGHWVVLFPEGISHNHGRLRNFKKGTAHIAKQFMADTQQPIRILETVLFYPDKSKLNSNIWVQVVSEKIYRPREAFDIITETQRWQQSIQQALPSLMNKAETQKIDWLNEQIARLNRTPIALNSARSHVRFQHKIAQTLENFSSSKLDLATLGRPHSPISFICNTVSNLLILLLGLPIAALGLLSHSVITGIHYGITRMQSEAADKWASNSFVIGIPLYLLFWLALSFIGSFTLAVLIATSGLYALFYTQTLSLRLRRLNSLMRLCVIPRSIQPALVKALATLRPFSVP